MESNRSGASHKDMHGQGVNQASVLDVQQHYLGNIKISGQNHNIHMYTKTRKTRISENGACFSWLSVSMINTMTKRNLKKSLLDLVITVSHPGKGRQEPQAGTEAEPYWFTSYLLPLGCSDTFSI